MSDDGPQLRAPEGMEIGVNFPFVLKLEHSALSLQEMFEVSKAFDLYEMEKNVGEDSGLVKESILVDVLECTPTSTTIKITPVGAMPYRLLASHTDLLVKSVGKKALKGKALKATHLKWEIDKTGVASDLRGMLRKVS